MGQIHGWLRKNCFWFSWTAKIKAIQRNRRNEKIHHWKILQWSSVEQANYWASQARKDLLLNQRLCKCRKSETDLPIARKKRSGRYARAPLDKTDQGGDHSAPKTTKSALDPLAPHLEGPWGTGQAPPERLHQAHPKEQKPFKRHFRKASYWAEKDWEFPEIRPRKKGRKNRVRNKVKYQKEQLWPQKWPPDAETFQKIRPF